MKVLEIRCILGAWLILHAVGVRGDSPVQVEEDAEEEGDLKVDEPDGLVNILVKNYEGLREFDDTCPRYSPAEVFHTYIHPHLLIILDERSYFVESVLSRVEASLHTLHMNHPSIGDERLKEAVAEVERVIFGSMKDMYVIIRAAWRDLIHAHAHAHAPPADTLAALTLVREAQQEGETRLISVLQEFSITLKTLVLKGMRPVQGALELAKGKRERATEEEEEAKGTNLPKVAPNFLGTLMSSGVERRGSEPSWYKRAFAEPFWPINPLVEQMHSSLEALVEGGGQAEGMGSYWTTAVEAAHRRLQECPPLREDFEAVFGDEEYLAGLVLQLMSSS